MDKGISFLEDELPDILKARNRFFIYLSFVPILLPLLNGFYKPNLLNTPLIFWALDLLGSTIIPLCIIYITVNYFKINSDFLRIQILKFGKISSIVILLLSPVVLVILTLVIKITIDDLFPVVLQKVPLTIELFTIKVSRITLVIYMACSAGIFEELYYKWLLPYILGKKLSNKHLVILVSTVIFSSIHWEQGLSGLIFAFVYGYISFYIYRLISNITPIIVAHIVVDLLLFTRY